MHFSKEDHNKYIQAVNVALLQNNLATKTPLPKQSMDHLGQVDRAAQAGLLAQVLVGLLE